MFQSKQNTKSAVKKRNLVSYTHPESMISEQYRMIHTNIKLIMAEQKVRILLITSAATGEGKSVTAANLAVSMAQQKEKILLIDANFRTPSLNFIFKIPNSAGLSEVLIGKERFEDAVYHTEIGRLDVLTSGMSPMNPGELLGSAMMEELLKMALHSYDIVLIDSYSINRLAYTKRLVKVCDGVILVIQKGKTTFEKAAEAKKELEFSKGKLIGVIFNEK